MSLAAYLAKNYLNADTLPSSDRPKKKRKKTKHSSADGTSGDGGGLIIADDDPPDLRSSGPTKSRKPRRGRGLGLLGDDDDNDDSDNEGLAYTLADSKSADFRKSKSKWQTVAGPVPPSNEDQVAADAILASAAAERDAQGDMSNEGPTIAQDDGADSNAAPRMESGARAGLQTAEQTAAMVAEQERRRQEDEAAMRRDGKRKKKSKDGGGGGGEEGETIYRDASGRIINVAMKRAEARKAAEEAAEKEEEAQKALTGDVQRREMEARRAALEDAKFMPLARKADDEELNDELRSRQRWNDPAAQFMPVSTASGGGAAGSKSRKKMYQGAAPPNRYGVRPGHRWDGVDRSNGFEHKWFESRNKKERMEGLEYAWQMDE